MPSEAPPSAIPRRRRRSGRGGRALTRGRELVAATASVVDASTTIRRRRQRLATATVPRMNQQRGGMCINPMNPPPLESPVIEVEEDDLSIGRLSLEDVLKRGQGSHSERLFPVNLSQKEIEEQGIQCIRKEMAAEAKKKNHGQAEVKVQVKKEKVTEKNVLDFGKLTGTKRVNQDGRVEFLVDWDNGKVYNTDDLCFDQPAGAYFKNLKSNEANANSGECEVEEGEQGQDSSSDESEHEVEPKRVDAEGRMDTEESASSKVVKPATEGKKGNCKVEVEEVVLDSSDDSDSDDGFINHLVERMQRRHELEIEREIEVVNLD